MLFGWSRTVSMGCSTSPAIRPFPVARPASSTLHSHGGEVGCKLRSPTRARTRGCLNQTLLPLKSESAVIQLAIFAADCAPGILSGETPKDSRRVSPVPSVAPWFIAPTDLGRHINN